jgi:hypothetical protein
LSFAAGAVRHDPKEVEMPKVLTEQQVRDFEEQAAAGPRVHGNRARELEACGGFPGQAVFEDSRYAPSEAYGGQRAAT